MRRNATQNKHWVLDLKDPPREIPISFKLKLLLNGGMVSAGWFVLGFGMIFVWVFGGTEKLHNLTFFSGELKETEAIILSRDETNVTINERRVYRYAYEYAIDDEKHMGSIKGYGNAFNVDQKVTIEYVIQDPSRSRIKNHSLISGSLSIFIGIFPMIGLILMLTHLRKAIKGIRLYSHGYGTSGVLISRTPTNTRINEQTVYKYVFQFKDDQGNPHEVTAKTHVRGKFSGEEGLESESTGSAASAASADSYSIDPDAGDEQDLIREPLLYLPDEPAKAIMLDSLPGKPSVNEFGDIRDDMGFIGGLILPVIILGGHLVWALHVMEQL